MLFYGSLRTVCAFVLLLKHAKIILPGSVVDPGSARVGVGYRVALRKVPPSAVHRSYENIF